MHPFSVNPYPFKSGHAFQHFPLSLYFNLAVFIPFDQILPLTVTQDSAAGEKFS